jgi:hypothetical protein
MHDSGNLPNPKVRFGTEKLPGNPRCSCGADGEPAERHEPGCDRTWEPFVDHQTWALVGAATGLLSGYRGGAEDDPEGLLSCLASLSAETQSRLPEAVADARGQGCSWAEVGSRLAISASAARRRYREYVSWRAELDLLES